MNLNISKMVYLLQLADNHGTGGGEGYSIVFHLSFLTHSACQYDVT